MHGNTKKRLPASPCCVCLPVVSTPTLMVAVMVKVVWTDYNSSALLYTCRGQVLEDGRCPGASLQVEFLSRSTALAPEAEMALMRRLPSVCVGEEEMEAVTTGGLPVACSWTSACYRLCLFECFCMLGFVCVCVWLLLTSLLPFFVVVFFFHIFVFCF